MASKLRLAVVGAGLIGKRHIQHVLAEPEAALAAIVDPSEGARALADELGVRWFAQLSDMIANDAPDGVIVATPNQLHVAHGLEAIAAGLPALIEKPVADDIESAERLVQAGEAAHVPILIGHHRRHNPVMRKAKDIIDSGQLGRVSVVHAMFWLFKPDDYYKVTWRTQAGAGPVFLNLIHDIDNLRFLFGDIIAVQGRESHKIRGYEVEDTSVILLEFASGILATVSVCDTVVAPWSWEMTSGENPAYPHEKQPSIFVGGTHASLTLPGLELWRNAGPRSWEQKFETSRIPVVPEDPLALQIRHFCHVIRGREQPLCSAREGLKTLRVTEAVKRAAASGQQIRLNPDSTVQRDWP